MILESGRKLGPYQIESAIGAGGMGEVYRAHDSRLRRTVAIKVLPSSLSGNPEARARFDNEARAIAGLSHPHICAIHDVGHEDGTDYLVMEYLEGETLATRIQRGPLPLKDVLRFGAEIADALERAHRAGITHRDLKPGNIMITATGAKLLDFGLAKTVARALSGDDQSNTLVQQPPLTAEGMILGTVQYMSPEQVENRNVDQRSDVFALGVVLYEMTTGRRPFGGSSPMSIVSSILSDSPASVRTLNRAIPAALERIITTSLEKNPDDRWQSAHDIAVQLRSLPDAVTTDEPDAAPSRQAVARRVLPYLLVAVAAVALTAAIMRARGTPTHATPVVRLHLSPPADAGTIRSGEVAGYAISPDGSEICFTATGKNGTALYVRDLDSFDARKIDGSDGASGPFWSDDGKSIGFSARRKLWRVSASGDTPPTALCDVASAGAAGTWHGDTIVFADAADGRRGIFRLAASGGEPVPLVKPSGSEWREALPYFLPDGKHFLYVAVSAQSMSRTLVFASADGKSRRELLQNVSQGRIGGDGRLLYVRDGKLLAQTFNQENGELSGQPVTIVDGVAFFLATATASFDATPSGVLAYRTNSRVDRFSIIDRAGTEKKLLDDKNRFWDLNIAPDGKQAAVTLLGKGDGMGDIWMYDLARGTRERFTSEPAMEFSSVFSPDGNSLYYAVASKTMPHVVKRDLGSSAVEPVTEEGRFRFPRSISPDGLELYVSDRSPESAEDILEVSTLTRGTKALRSGPGEQVEPMASPNGRYLAYSDDASGSPQVYVLDLKTPASLPFRVSDAGGWAPRWRLDGQELFFLSPDRRSVFAARSEHGDWKTASTGPLFNTPNEVIDYHPLPDSTFAVLQGNPNDEDDLLHVVITR